MQGYPGIQHDSIDRATAIQSNSDGEDISAKNDLAPVVNRADFPFGIAAAPAWLPPPGCHDRCGHSPFTRLHSKNVYQTLSTRLTAFLIRHSKGM